jgi:hypothetical protein
MNAFVTYVKLNLLSMWYAWLEKWTKQQTQNAESVNKALRSGSDSYYLADSYQSIYSVFGKGSPHSNYNLSNIAGIQPITVSQLSTLSLNSTGVSTLNNNEQSQPIQFTIHNADGGKVVEYVISDNGMKKTKLHVVTPEQDLGSALGKIITLELLRS